MRLNELKKAKPATWKSSGTDDPKKYIGKWEVYDEPQGIKDRQDPKVLAMEDEGSIANGAWLTPDLRVIPVNPRKTGGHANVAIDYFISDEEDGEKYGWRGREAVDQALWAGWIRISTMDAKRSKEGPSVAVQFNKINQKQAIKLIKLLKQYGFQSFDLEIMYENYTRLNFTDFVDALRGSINVRESNSFGPQQMHTRFGPEPEPYHLIVGPDEQKAIKQSKKAPKKQARTNARALSARGKPPHLDPRKDITERIRRPFLGSLTARYEIEGEEGDTVGMADVKEGVVETLYYDTDASQEYRGQILSALFSMITNEADHHQANLSIQVHDMTSEIKALLERFGFRQTRGSVMKRNAGSIRPTSVNPPQGMVNRINEEALTKTDLHMGLSQYVNNEVALIGGFRSGNSPPNTFRLRYMVYDMSTFDQNDPDKSKVGLVDLFVSDDGNIKGIVNIELDKSARGAGMGRKIIRSLLDTVDGPLQVHDIQPKSRGFWDKMGVEYTNKSKREGIIRSKKNVHENENLDEKIAAIVKEVAYEMTGDNKYDKHPCDLAHGKCWDFADAAASEITRRLGIEARVSDTDEYFEDTPGIEDINDYHAWVEANGKVYDGEHLEGADNPFSLSHVPGIYKQLRNRE